MEATLELLSLGVSHERMGVARRERFAVAESELAGFLGPIAGQGVEAAMLSTCNRSELYVAAADGEAAIERALVELSALSGLSPPELRDTVVLRRGPDAATHLFRVAAGLESLVPGEAEILGQVRRAHAAARAAATVGPVIDRLFRQALRAGRRARSETAIAERPASVPAVACLLAERIFAGELAGARVLVIGAGETAELVGVALRSRGVQAITIANRTTVQGQRLAERLGGASVPFGELVSALEAADIVISATSAQGRILTRDEVAPAVRARRGRPLLLLDLAVPRDVDPEVAGLRDCFLYGLDDLQHVVRETLTERLRDASRVEAIVAEEAARFVEWWRSREVVPAISSLRAFAEEIRLSELRRASGRLQGLSPRELRAVEFLTSQIVNKLLHPPTVRLKEASLDGRADAATLRHLFGLDEQRP